MASQTIETAYGTEQPDRSLTTLRASLLRTERAGAVLRIVFGIIWAIDATFKWLPGFIHGQTLPDELGKGPEIQTPVIHHGSSSGTASVRTTRAPSPCPSRSSRPSSRSA
jgi:hypothetical protein